MPEAELDHARRRLLTWGPPLLLAAAVTPTLGGPGLAAILLASIPWLAWRLDNASGSYFLLSLLFLIAVTVPAMLLALMAVTH